MLVLALIAGESIIIGHKHPDGTLSPPIIEVVVRHVNFSQERVTLRIINHFPPNYDFILSDLAPNSRFVVSDDLIVLVAAFRSGNGGKVRIGVDAPQSTYIHRKSYYNKIKAEEDSKSQEKTELNKST